MKLSRALFAGAALVTVLAGGTGMAWAGGSQPSAHAQAAATAPSGLNYVPVTQCTAVDLEMAGGPMPAWTTRDFTFSGDLTAQGGDAGCGVPATATAVAVVIVAMDNSGNTDGTGDLSAWPPNTDWPGTEVLAVAGTEDKSTSAILAMYQGSVRFEDLGFSTALKISIAGYYAPTGPEIMTGSINYDGSLKSGPHITKSVLVGSTQYQVTFDRDITDCSFQLTSTSGAILFGGPNFYAPSGITNTLLISWTVFGAPNPPFEQSAFNLAGTCP